jgi:hypothetical protein
MITCLGDGGGRPASAKFCERAAAALENAETKEALERQKLTQSAEEMEADRADQAARSAATSALVWALIMQQANRPIIPMPIPTANGSAVYSHSSGTASGSAPGTDCVPDTIPPTDLVWSKQ